MSLEEELKKLVKRTSKGSTTTSSKADPAGTPGEIDLDNPCAICGGEPFCGGLGMVRYDVEMGHPMFGKMVRCPYNPQDADERLRERLREVGNLTAFRDKTFDSFQIDEEMHTPSEQQSLTYAINVARRFAEDPHGWLLLEGTYGCGKTHLAAAVANVRLLHGQTAIFITVPDLLDHLRSAYGPSSEVGYDNLFDRIRNTELLILDDLGVENPSAWAQEKLFQLLNHRYVSRLPTIITTNSDIDTIDPRIRSRLLDVNLISRLKVSAPDYRSLVQNRHTQLNTSLTHYAQYTFQTFDAESYTTADERRNLHKALNNVISYAENPEGHWYTLIGNHGTGKTHLAAAAANARQSIGDEVMFITVPELMDYLRVAFSPGASTSFDQRFNAVKNVSFLVLDDLHTGASSAWAKEKLFQILDFRYVRQMPTLITAGDNIEKVDERIRVRLFDERVNTAFRIDAESYAIRLRRRNTRQ